tara:strand:- start:294 stop:461 length:168 start_codon:yes stop_codon:yes gene_type:complete
MDIDGICEICCEPVNLDDYEAHGCDNCAADEEDLDGIIFVDDDHKAAWFKLLIAL